MTTTANLAMNASLLGDVNLADIFSIVANTASPGQEQIVDLLLGANTITIPTGGASVAVGCIIRPPAGNVNVLTLKGVDGDTGVALHKTNPSYIGLDAVVSFVLDAGAATAGVRLLFI
jgi:hypothetical protein